MGERSIRKGPWDHPEQLPHCPEVNPRPGKVKGLSQLPRLLLWCSPTSLSSASFHITQQRVQYLVQISRLAHGMTGRASWFVSDNSGTVRASLKCLPDSGARPATQQNHGGVVFQKEGQPVPEEWNSPGLG